MDTEIFKGSFDLFYIYVDVDLVVIEEHYVLLRP
jgi:hypothetical protein